MARYGLYMILGQQIHSEEMKELRRKRKIQRELCNPFEQPDMAFQDRYRLTKGLAHSLIEELKPYLPRSKRSHGISTEVKVLTAFSFYATGSYQRSVGDSTYLSMAQCTVSNCIREVTDALNHPAIVQKYIKFPLNPEERNKIKKEFYEECGIPGVIGCIDCTHVAIIKPSNHEERFFNRKHYHSLNVQIICDSDLQILSVDASHPGATNDCIIWQMHPLYEYLRNCRQNGETLWMLGDSGYPQRNILMTPILNALPGTKERIYTDMHMSARNCVERCIGVLKSRFRCLLAARVLNYEPDVAAKIVNACCVLHNIAHGARLQVPALTEQEQREEQQRQVQRQNVENDTIHAGELNYRRFLADPCNRRVNRDLLAGRAERNALIDRICVVPAALAPPDGTSRAPEVLNVVSTTFRT
ncbi:Putative nuclease HARBI1 [Eumeta japonica]|uniref:Nuclease HARBI1 n=1 Tax=Eumeta variegata TaxID=151549 RepID=A0A4C1SYU1_EUMVA|nr:Putative nuclease HARBI1 [Eumeta japonica]